MAEEIRIFKNDSVCLQFNCIDADTGESLDLTQYEVIFSTETFGKTSISKPLEVKKDVDADGNSIILVYLTESETNTSLPWLHYTLKIYQLSNPNHRITGSSGDLRFITE